MSEDEMRSTESCRPSLAHPLTSSPPTSTTTSPTATVIRLSSPISSRNAVTTTTTTTALAATVAESTTTTTTTTTTTNARRSSSTSKSWKRWRFCSLGQYAGNLHVSRTTIVLFAVTVAFFLSFFPALAVMVVRTVVKDFQKTQSMSSLAVTKVFSKFNFINNAINPIIYSFLNVHFRRQARKAVSKLFCCRRCRCADHRISHRRGPRRGYGSDVGRQMIPLRHHESDRSTKKVFLHLSQ